MIPESVCFLADLDLADALAKSGLAIGTLIAIGALIMIVRCYRKVEQGKALVRTGLGGTRVSFGGMLVYPVVHKLEIMDISLKRIEIDRSGPGGLICRDNIRADIKVAFFVRVNKTPEDVERVAQSIGCERASNPGELEPLFDAKFSEALKTVGKRFDFTSLYEERDTFRDEIVKVIGTNLNGFVLDDCSIDYLEQTSVTSLNPQNILDAEGIKKITERTSEQAKLTNAIDRDRERIIKQQDVQAKEAILELERQLAETEAKQKREVESVRAREGAEALKIQQENRQKSEQARIAAEEEIMIAEENKNRQIIVAQRNKERTDAVETVRIERDREMESIEKERMVALKSIERDKAVEIEKKNIQDVIKDRVALEKTVVIEQQKIKDTEAFATADREKQVAITQAEKAAQEILVRRIKEAEADKEAARLRSEQDLLTEVKSAEARRSAAQLLAEEMLVTAEARQAASEKESSAKKMMAEALTAESAAAGLGEAQVLVAKAGALEKQGAAEAAVSRLKFEAEAQGIQQKAEAMKLFEQAGQTHEEFKLRLEKEKAVEIAGIQAQKDISASQALVVGEALKYAKIDIVGGEGQFFDRIAGAVSNGKAVDRLIGSSKALTDVKETFFNGDPDYFKAQLQTWIGRFGITSDDLKNLTLSALLGQMLTAADDEPTRQGIRSLKGMAERFGVAGKKAGEVVNRIIA